MYQVALSQSYFPAQTDIAMRNTSIGALLREIAAQHPSAEALVEICPDGTDGRLWTYSELLAEAEKLARALLTRFSPGERLGVWSPNSPEWVLMEYACALAGLVLVTANPSFQVRELRYVLEQSGAVGLFTVDEFRGNPMAKIAAEAVKGLAHIREVTDLNKADALYATGDRSVDLPEVAPETPAQIQYTSGTTGFPKGAVLSHFGLMNNARFYATRCGVYQSSTWAIIVPLFHTAGCAMGVLGCMQAGARIVLISLFDPALVNAAVTRHKVDRFLGIPTMVLAMLEEQEAHPQATPDLKLINSGGASVAPELVRRVEAAFGCTLTVCYGQTETSPVITAHHAADHIDDLCSSTGQPMANTEVSIRSTSDNSLLPLDTVGEVCARGHGVMLEYNDNPAATAETIDKDGWLHTGDLGRMDARGYLTITGRVKDMIIRGGENHFPIEIENILLEHADVAEIAVVGLPDEKWGEVIGAFIRTSGGTLDKDALHAHCRANMSPQKTPTIWCQVDAFPLTGSGKIRKFVLRENFEKGQYEVA